MNWRIMKAGAVVVAALAVAACKGATGPEGQPGARGDAGTAVSVASVDPGNACSFGGASFTSGSATAYACSGAPGAQGARGDKGDAGDSVVVASLDPGSACTFGGAEFLNGVTTARACNGAPGASAMATVLDSTGAAFGRLVGVSNRAANPPYSVWAKLLHVLDSNGTLWTVDSAGNVFSDLAQQTEYYESTDCSGTPLLWMGSPQSPVSFGSAAGTNVYKGVPPVVSATAKSYRQDTSPFGCVQVTQALSAFRTVSLGVLPLSSPAPGPYTIQ